MNTWLHLIVVAALFLVSACASRPDWIEQTLVTADVTGVWVGQATRPSAHAGVLEVRLELEQSGSKVKGHLTVMGAGSAGADTLKSEPIEGTVAGDIFSFFSQSKGSLSGRLTVAGDDMAGVGTVMIQRQFSLRRISPSPRPASQP